MAQAEDMRPGERIERVRLSFRERDELDHVDDAVRMDLSAAAVLDRSLFVACDETATLERLVAGDNGFDGHRNTALGAFFDLPEGPDGEMDIEGLDIDGGYLWVTGSHSLTRDKPEPDENDLDEALEELTDIDRDPNRFFLGRIPLHRGDDGVHDLVAEDGARVAGCLPLREDGGNALTDAAAGDIHFGPFLDVPCKENGFDVEGIAARGDRVLLGLRGPVLRGWAIVLELAVDEADDGRRLQLRPIGPDGAPYRKHLLDLRGLGVRDLALFDDDALVLAGPTMDLDGPVIVFRWRRPLDIGGPSITPRSALDVVAELPYGPEQGHAEGLTVLADWPGRPLLIVYDTPGPDRLVGANSTLADVVALGSPVSD